MPIGIAGFFWLLKGAPHFDGIKKVRRKATLFTDSVIVSRFNEAQKLVEKLGNKVIAESDRD